MLEAFKVEKKKTVAASIKDLSKSHFVWLDYTAPSDKELKELEKVLEIPLEDLEKVDEDYERSKIFEYDNYSLIVYGSAVEHKHSFKTIPVFIFLSKNNNVVTIKKEEIGAIAKIKGMPDDKKIRLMENQTYFVYRLLDNLNNQFFEVLDEIDEVVEHIEEEVMRSTSKTLINKIFRAKKSLIFFHKTLIANREVIAAIEKEYLPILSKKEVRRYRDLYNDVIQLIDMEETHRDILTNVLEIHLTNTSNTMNEIVKRITVYGSYVLVPTLIASIYGMNFRNMPELFWGYGYLFALGLMVVSVLGIWILFKKKKWT